MVRQGSFDHLSLLCLLTFPFFLSWYLVGSLNIVPSSFEKPVDCYPFAQFLLLNKDTAIPQQLAKYPTG